MTKFRFLADLPRGGPLVTRVRKGLTIFGELFELVSAQEQIPALQSQLQRPDLTSNLGLQAWAESIRANTAKNVVLNTHSFRGSTVLETLFWTEDRAYAASLSLHVFWSTDEEQRVLLILDGDKTAIELCKSDHLWSYANAAGDIPNSPSQLELSLIYALSKMR